MLVYCSHSVKQFTKASNFYRCSLCPATWYGIDKVPLVVIGDTNPDNISPRRNVDLSKKRFKRCDWCKDVIEQREHYRCAIKRWLDKLTVGPAPDKKTKKS
jgi:hypothetical protein